MSIGTRYRERRARNNVRVPLSEGYVRNPPLLGDCPHVDYVGFQECPGRLIVRPWVGDTARFCRVDVRNRTWAATAVEKETNYLETPSSDGFLFV